MKLIIQIPCLNEEKTICSVVNSLPKKIEGVGDIEVLVIDDCSTDNTYQAAKGAGVDHIIRLKQNRGLAHAFSVGLNESLRRGADIIVNTDGDNQYRGEDISKLDSDLFVNWGAV